MLSRVSESHQMWYLLYLNVFFGTQLTFKGYETIYSARLYLVAVIDLMLLSFQVMMWLGLLQLDLPIGKIHMPKADQLSHQICLFSSPKMQASPCTTDPSPAEVTWPRLCLVQPHCPSLQCLPTAAAARRPWVKIPQVTGLVSCTGFWTQCLSSCVCLFSTLLLFSSCEVRWIPTTLPSSLAFTRLAVRR